MPSSLTRIKTVANLLVAAGALLGIATVAAIALGYSPSLTPEMVKLLFYKGLGAAAVGLMVVGAIVGRFGHRHADNTKPTISGGTAELLRDSNQVEFDAPSTDRVKSPNTIESRE